MVFKINNYLIDKDSNLDIDLEVSTMTKFYEVEKIFQKIDDSNLDDRQLWLVMLIYRLSEIFQNCMRSYEYLEGGFGRSGLRSSFLQKCNTDSSLAFLKKKREDMFHNSKSTLNRTIHSNFFQIDGEYFKGIHIKKGGMLQIGEDRFKANDSEFAFTTEGIFEIKNPFSKDERWEKLKYPSIITFDDKDIINKLRRCLDILRSEFFKIRKILKHGDGRYECEFNKKGNIRLFEGGKEYNLNGKSLEIKGAMRISPMSFGVDLISRKIKRS